MNQGFDDFNTDPSNPFFLHSSENPSLILVSPLFNGKNFHSWSRAMKLVLQSKNKLNIIDHNITQPPFSSPLYAQWLRCNTMILSWIQHSVEESIVKSILWINSAAETWQDLYERFCQGNMFRIAELQEDFYKLNQGNLSISDYFTQLKILWEEIENFRSIGHCRCSMPCSCGIIELVKAYRDQDYIIRF
ncbi:PREDICTED: uncharacterized protein LOC109327316 [Lupinus angustifolius]|uniref:uncharacterized protein LOC109327316 n=1 Tax=Lupinus angustifolius TaxID=3871 RepID=UPI00092E1F66|nr:PREDICTED: uncharacterized protein LOC109327316 [Lupinus angustifolius]